MVAATSTLLRSKHGTDVPEGAASSSSLAAPAATSGVEAAEVDRHQSVPQTLSADDVEEKLTESAAPPRLPPALRSVIVIPPLKLPESDRAEVEMLAEVIREDRRTSGRSSRKHRELAEDAVRAHSAPACSREPAPSEVVEQAASTMTDSTLESGDVLV